VGTRPTTTASVGKQLRALRELRGLSLEEVSQRSGVSLGLLSQLERGRGNPSLSTLERIATSLVVPLTTLFSGRVPREPVVRAGERTLLDLHPGGNRGVRHELLTPSLNGALQVVEMTLPPGYDGSDSPFEHQGEEFGTVLTGRVDVCLDGEVHQLNRGDSITYLATTPHYYRVPGGKPAVMLWVITPPAF
jgi:transcriptional regulator with XRE-family HTH domain